jgi:hypothetical protein
MKTALKITCVEEKDKMEKVSKETIPCIFFFSKFLSKNRASISFLLNIREFASVRRGYNTVLQVEVVRK